MTETEACCFESFFEVDGQWRKAKCHRSFVLVSGGISAECQWDCLWFI